MTSATFSENLVQKKITLAMAAAPLVMLFGMRGRAADAPAAAPQAVAAAAPVSAGEWPQWRGPRGDSIVRDTSGLLDKWPQGGPKKLWTHPTGIGFSSPIGFEGKVYLFSLDDGNKETLTALDAESGKPAWSQSYTIGKSPDYEGVRATPTIENGKIYTYGSTGILTCRELADGKQAWQLDVLKELNEQMLGAPGSSWGQASSPLIAGDNLYVQAGKGGPVAICVDKKTGKITWKSEASGVGGYAAPILVDVAGKQQLIIFAGQAVLGMEPSSGKTIWTHPWKDRYDISATTPIYHDGDLFVSSGGGTGSMMLQLSAAGAKKLWAKKDIQCKFQPPILDNGYLYANGDERGTIKCIKWPTGEIQWKAEDPKLGFGGSLVRLGNDKLIAMSQTGTLSLMLATPDKNELISSVDLFTGDERVWATPLVYKGKLYCKSKDQLVCLNISK